MSCEDCSKAQEESAWVMPIRVGNGNLLVKGCKKHLRELCLRLDRARLVEEALSMGAPQESLPVKSMLDDCRQYWDALSDREKEIARKIFGGDVPK
jgi:hypothetical protein